MLIEAQRPVHSLLIIQQAGCKALALHASVCKGTSSNVDAEQRLKNGLKWEAAVQRSCFKVKHLLEVVRALSKISTKKRRTVFQR